MSKGFLKLNTVKITDKKRRFDRCFLSWAPSSSTDLHMWRPKSMSSPLTLASCCLILLSDFRPTGRTSPKNAIVSKLLFFRLKYPDKLLNSTILRFIATKVSDQPVSSPSAVSDSSDPVRGILPFTDQSSADIVRRQLQDFTNFTRPCLQCFSAKRLNAILKCKKVSHLLPAKILPPAMSHVYKFECDLCDAGYVG